MSKEFLIIFMLIAYQLKHFLCDYILQTERHLAKFNDKGWFLPLLDHCCIHGMGTTFILFITYILSRSNDDNLFYYIIPCLILFDIVIHFIIDRIKASKNFLGRYDIRQKQFWLSLGLDQMVHHLTHYVIIYMMFTSL